jgi:predicted transcriptional regulator
VVGALLAVLQTRLLASEPEPPTTLRGELMGLILLPYLGGVAARRELARPAGRSTIGRRSQPPRSGRAAMEGMGPRLTYRTARVLTAIAERPGSSNREVANRAEVVDQGQISKLLSRLEVEGLIANVGDGGLRGAPNAWELTLRGEQLQHTIARTAAATPERTGRR